MNERIRNHRGKIEQAGIDTPVIQTGLPGGMSMLREETGAWTIRDSEGYVRGLGRDPQGAIFAVFRVGEVRSVLTGWNSFNKQREEEDGLRGGE